ncbi:MAG: PilZ domain-containing protein [Desulfobacterales bacterium]|nr:MAG: PilZ domain-containing protein [Desulfobacterales bacterium]
MKNHTAKISSDRRKDSRQPYAGCVFFATSDRLYEGQLTNYSRYGLFIKTCEFLPVGQIITVAIPFSNGRNDKRKGQIIRNNVEGFAVELLRKYYGERMDVYH